MYKDPDRQREANKERQRRRRDKIKAKGVTKQGVTKGMTLSAEVIPNHPGFVVPKRGKEHSMECDPKILAEFKEGKTNPKRGKDIKCFEDLPPDVQQAIDRMSVVDGKLDGTIKANRTAIAINYQHLYPDRFYSTGRGAAC